MNYNNSSFEKYIKYKNKYNILKKQIGGNLKLPPYEHLHVIDKSNIKNYMFLNVKAKKVTLA
jgi:hypothetical protein